MDFPHYFQNNADSFIGLGVSTLSMWVLSDSPHPKVIESDNLQGWGIFSEIGKVLGTAAARDAQSVFPDSPPAFHILPNMLERNWLVSYATIEGLQIILFQMDHRTKNRVSMHESIVELQHYYNEFEVEFTLFFGELRQHCSDKLKELNA